MTLLRVHRVLGLLVAVFILGHLANHLALHWGADRHIAVMKVLRPFYRPIVLEVVLLAGLAAQLLVGMALVRRRGRPDGLWAWAQVLSGGYLLFFLMQHVPAVVFTRAYFGLDTNVHFAAAPVHSAPLMFYFAPYYVMAVTAFFTHLAAALHFALWPRRMPVLWVIPMTGLVFGIWIVAQLMQVDVQPAYLH